MEFLFFFFSVAFFFSILHHASSSAALAGRAAVVGCVPSCISFPGIPVHTCETRLYTSMFTVRSDIDASVVGLPLKNFCDHAQRTGSHVVHHVLIHTRDVLRFAD